MQNRQMYLEAPPSPNRRAHTSKCLTDLENRFNRKLPSETFRQYSQMLEAELTVTQLDHAVAIVFRNDDFFPSPKRLIECIQGSPEDKAEDAWDNIMHCLRNNAIPSLANTSLNGLRALANVGGMNTLREAEDSNLMRFRKTYTSAFVRYERREPGAAIPTREGLPRADR